MSKKIKNISVVKAGSNPDIDSDFHTEHREEAIRYVTELYGKDNVANIITFGTLAAKSAFKSLCTIYKVPFKEANQIASLVPGPVEGQDIKLHEIFDETHYRYEDGAEFRNAVSSDKWKDILQGALDIEGKNKSTGVHACGVIISSKPLQDTIPLQVRQEDNKTITQWIYQECEDIGLIKMDFLGLDTVDLIQATVENIIKAGKTPPNMVELIHGDLNDEKIFKMFQDGTSIGVFQFGSDMVRELLQRMQPTEFNDLVACTAIARPGPMGMKSHEKYCDRKNGLEKVDYIHKDFIGSPMEQVLGPTYGLCVFQEQITQIANQIAGMTLQEGDDLRKAMGKKKVELMKSMKPKFINGGIANGYSEEAMVKLWNTIEPFSLYAFNKSHSVAYALDAYQSAYLKVHYPVEFMSAIISQHIKKRDKTLMHIQEARRMGLIVNPPSVNKSSIKIEPDFDDNSWTNINFGLSAIKDIGEKPAEILIKEREDNGSFSSIHDLVKRCTEVGIGKKVILALIYSGACDEFNDNRKAMAEFALEELETQKKNKKKGDSLFDLFNSDEINDKFDNSIKETFSERIANEADFLSIYLTAHPMDNMKGNRKVSLKSINKGIQKGDFNLYASCVSQDVKRGRGRVSYKLDIEDTSGNIVSYVPRDVVARWDKHKAQQQVMKAINSNSNIKDEVWNIAFNPKVVAQPPVEKNEVAQYYISTSNYGTRITNVLPSRQSDNGSLGSLAIIPYPLSLSKEEQKSLFDEKIERLKELSKKYPGDKNLFVSFVPEARKKGIWGDVVNTPAQIFDNELLEVAEEAGLIDKNYRIKYLKSLYKEPLLDINDKNISTEDFEKLHKLYKYNDYDIKIDIYSDDLPYLLDEILGDGNYYLKK